MLTGVADKCAGHKVLIFCTMTRPLDSIEEVLEHYGCGHPQSQDLDEPKAMQHEPACHVAYMCVQ